MQKPSEKPFVQPSNLLLKVARRLFTNDNEQAKFIEALVHPQPFSACIIWCENQSEQIPFPALTPLVWQPQFVNRLLLGEKPGQHPLHHQGYFYCLDFSSVFSAGILLTIAENSEKVPMIFDMCAAPGGKSIFAWKLFQPNLLICNEVIGKRLGMLISNLKRCKIHSSVVLNRDSSVLGEIFAETSNLVIVDAPCTGQSLLAKGEKAPGCFHPTAINKSANRQKRIIANSAKIVAPQGYLAYMTCTYSPEENEQVCEWFLERFPHFQAVEASHLSSYQSHLTNIPCYRMFPQNQLGAGAFTVLFKNTNLGEGKKIDSDDIVSMSIYQNISP
ncbi:RsmB/NOP family class I SAM-dependent RNA methyltransferase [Anabaena sp. FACHB-1237]|uniref:RsmB/NOP family class I SAM-dependent RNA methyltransferase n=1 Tax=Anabaena sp. FACHB-1237 TaxID=2692769 RepID=UPI0016819074|nr:RsmB/NOP family class I SAM-dependent RNA methyltransferase [Anabaena sp. FACHB-1237]MBD2136160.1 RsmB/NOP family class I SAM-dependent RNA methyltransferase [Anabaena sp. FACHB-1237]